MRGQLPFLARSGRASRFWSSCYAFLGLAAAATALAIPGPTGEVCGIASILAVAGLARLAGHGWGNAVSGAAATLQIAHLWPIVKLGQHSGWGGFAAATSLAISIILALGFAARLPRRMPAIIGRRLAGGRGVDMGLSAAIVMLLLALPAAVVQEPSDGVSIPIVASAVTASSPVELASAGSHVEAAAPGALEDIERHLDRGRGAAAGLEGDAKAIAADATGRHQLGALRPDQGLDLARAVLAVGDDEAGGGLAESDLVDALSGAAWQTEIDAERPDATDGALGQRDQ
jgi:hypothetical protein